MCVRVFNPLILISINLRSILVLKLAKNGDFKLFLVSDDRTNVLANFGCVLLLELTQPLLQQSIILDLYVTLVQALFMGKLGM